MHALQQVSHKRQERHSAIHPDLLHSRSHEHELDPPHDVTARANWVMLQTLRAPTLALTTSVPASWMRAASACALSAGRSTRGWACAVHRLVSKLPFTVTLPLLLLHISVSLSGEVGAWRAVNMELGQRMSVTAGHLRAAQRPGPVGTSTVRTQELNGTGHQHPPASARACTCAQNAHRTHISDSIMFQHTRRTNPGGQP